MGPVTDTHLAIFAVAIVVMVIFVARNLWKHRNVEIPPIKKAQGQALSRRINDPAGVGGKPSSRAMYYITFRLASGEEIELGMWAENYNSIAEGDWGSFIYRGSRLIEFTKDTDQA